MSAGTGSDEHAFAALLRNQDTLVAHVVVLEGEIRKLASRFDELERRSQPYTAPQGPGLFGPIRPEGAR